MVLGIHNSKTPSSANTHFMPAIFIYFVPFFLQKTQTSVGYLHVCILLHLYKNLKIYPKKISRHLQNWCFKPVFISEINRSRLVIGIGCRLSSQHTESFILILFHMALKVLGGGWHRQKTPSAHRGEKMPSGSLGCTEMYSSTALVQTACCCLWRSGKCTTCPVLQQARHIRQHLCLQLIGEHT